MVKAIYYVIDSTLNGIIQLLMVEIHISMVFENSVNRNNLKPESGLNVQEYNFF